EGRYRDPFPPDLAAGHGAVAVVAHERGHVEGRAEAGLPVAEKVFESSVSVFGGAEAGELAHSPEAAPVHSAVYAACVGKLTGVAYFGFGVETSEIAGVGERRHVHAGYGGEIGVALMHAGVITF